ncbi:MAG: Asp23/Gls24 family envelope stress response protein [Clostridia bacterium]|nr:Asp23/Gls24 family envelope stress response protein [Clostridia bacterium]
MKIYALVGESGTGKSYNAIAIAEKYNADYIIDDGLLISQGKVVAGSSAKKESCIIAAVKRAIFEDEASRMQMRSAIEESSPVGILILGTSDRMVQKIRTRLELPEFEQIIHIEDVASAEDIAKARLMRQGQGKHVIPVPAPEIRKTFSGYFLDALRVFRKNSQFADNPEEKSIVRPSYSYRGEFVINDTVLCTLASYEASRCTGVDRIVRVSLDKSESNVIFNIDVVLSYGVDIKECSGDIINRVKQSIEEYTSVYTDAVNVTVKSLSVK